jgi:hypothetical protein
MASMILGSSTPIRPRSNSVAPAATIKFSGLRFGGGKVVRYRSRMTTLRPPLYADYRYPAELISYAVWLYFQFPLSLRIVEEILAVLSALAPK